MAAPTYIASSAIAAIEADANKPVTVTLPAHETNDVFLLSGGKTNAGVFTVDGLTMTLIGAQSSSSNWSYGYWWARAASGAEADPTLTVSGAALSSTIGLYGQVHVFRGCITTGDPFEDATLLSNNGGASDNNPDSSTIDTTGADRLVVCCLSIDDDAALTNAGGLTLTERSEVSSTLGGDARFWTGDLVQAAAGTYTGEQIGTLATAEFWSSLTLALIPEAAAAAPNNRLLLGVG